MENFWIHQIDKKEEQTEVLEELRIPEYDPEAYERYKKKQEEPEIEDDDRGVCIISII